MERIHTYAEQIFISFFNVPPTNRSDIKIDNIQHTVGIPIPDHIGFNKTLDTIISERANVIKNYDNVALMLSGGIDSTLVFYALIDAGIEFDVISTRDLEDEYELLYNKLKNKEYSNVKNFILLEDKENEYFDLSAYTIVTGEGGDQMVGSDKFFNYPIHELQNVYSRNIPKELDNIYGEPIKKIVGRTPSLSAYLWAMNFVYKFTEVLIRFKIYNNLNKNIRAAHFFNTEDFQKWALVNYKTNTSFNHLCEYKSAYNVDIFSKNTDVV